MLRATEKLADSDFHLFDGQQRLAAHLLGLGEGPFSHSLRLWIDIGKLKGSGDRLYELRVNSTGQPFGYRSAAPNEKIRAEERRHAHDRWPTLNGQPQPPHEIFKEMAKEPIGQLSSANCAVPLEYILTKLIDQGKEAARDELRALAANVAPGTEIADLDDLLTGLQKALDAKIIVSLLDATVLDESNYARFFARLGQGGTRLSDEELIYSLIKNRYPWVHDTVAAIVNDTGRFASEVDLVLGALRVAQTLAPRQDAKEWEKAGRPTPDRVRKLYEEEGGKTESYFLSMLPNDKTPAKLQDAIQNLRLGLRYDTERNPKGLPSMLLARLPRDLLDVLLLFTFKPDGPRKWEGEGEDQSTLIAFVLHWLIFVAYDDKAAYLTFKKLQAKDWRFEKSSVAALIRHFKDEGAARHAPRPSDWSCLMKEVQERGCRLATWAERFSSEDVDVRRGEALRVLSTHHELQKRALIWLQRRYITGTFAGYDPTSTRDDDLPFDLDHAIPYSLFGFHWSDSRKPINLSATDIKRFEDYRKTIGDSLGNLRWLAAADNRRRGNGIMVEDGDQAPLDDHIDKDAWNKLIPSDNNKKWTDDDVATFQRLIDSRTLRLTQILMNESGITDLIDIVDGMNATPST